MVASRQRPVSEWLQMWLRFQERLQYVSVCVTVRLLIYSQAV
jgi:hypothetical protein